MRRLPALATLCLALALPGGAVAEILSKYSHDSHSPDDSSAGMDGGHSGESDDDLGTTRLELPEPPPSLPYAGAILEHAHAIEQRIRIADLQRTGEHEFADTGNLQQHLVVAGVIQCEAIMQKQPAV